MRIVTNWEVKNQQWFNVVFQAPPVQRWTFCSWRFMIPKSGSPGHTNLILEKIHALRMLSTSSNNTSNLVSWGARAKGSGPDFWKNLSSSNFFGGFRRVWRYRAWNDPRELNPQGTFFCCYGNVWRSLFVMNKCSTLHIVGHISSWCIEWVLKKMSLTLNPPVGTISSEIVV